MYKMVKKYKDDESNVMAVNPKLRGGGKVKLSLAAIRKANPKSVLKKAGTINPQLASKRKLKIVKKKKKKGKDTEGEKPKKKKVAKAVAMPRVSKPKKKAAEGTTSAAMKKDKKMKGMSKIRKAPGTY